MKESLKEFVHLPVGNLEKIENLEQLRALENGMSIELSHAQTIPISIDTNEDLEAFNPNGYFLSNGPGDPEATGSYAIKIIKEIIDQEIPTFGICLGHQILALALGGKTNKMHQGHHGANHPVKDMESGKVTITSMNHGFAVDYKSLPSNIIQTHLSLFDESNCGIKISNKPIF